MLYYVRRCQILKYFKTWKMKIYFIKFAFRLAAVIIMLYLYIRDKEAFYEYTITPIKRGFNFMHLMWLVYMGLMSLHIVPPRFMTMGAGKKRKVNYVPVDGYSELELLKYVQNENKKAWRSMLAWFGLNSIFAILFFTGVIGKPELVLLTTIYFLCDYICILLFCPFQTFGQKDKCCVNCRIYDWGHFFMFTPMLFLNTFFGWTLFLMGTAVIITWEFAWTLHPERFWEGSNQILKCANCKDQTCTVKRRNTRAILSLLKK